MNQQKWDSEKQDNCQARYGEYSNSQFFSIFFFCFCFWAMFRSRFLRCFVIANQMFYPMLPFVSNLMSLIPTRIKNHARLEEIRKSIDPYYFSLIDPYYFSLLYSYDTEIILNTFAFLLSVISFRFAVIFYVWILNYKLPVKIDHNFLVIIFLFYG